MGLENIGWRLYLVWAVITFAGIPVVFCLFPETVSFRVNSELTLQTGRTLEQMDSFFARYQRWYIADVANAWVELPHDGDEDGNATPNGKGSAVHMERQEKV